jgi:peptidyl-prolyl cis-trans isomerase SurA
LDPEQYIPLKKRVLVLGRNKPYEFEGKQYVVDLKEELPVMRKEFSEAKGAVTSDYQNFLEKSWMDELQKKYTITIYPDVLYKIGEN